MAFPPSLSQVKYRLASRRNLDKGELESLFSEMVRVIGGTYYSSGTPVGPSNGLMDWRNFSPYAGIHNQNKASPYSVFPIHLLNGNVTIGTTLTIRSVNNQSSNQSLEVVAITATYKSMGAAANTGTIIFNYIRGGVTTQIGTTVNYVNLATTPTVAVNQTGLSVPLEPDDILEMSWASAGTNANGTTGCIWVKSLHVK